jgi:hypothetical protein
MSARRRAKVVNLPCPADAPGDSAITLGGDVARVAGHLRGLVSALHEFNVADGHDRMLTREEQERRSWLYEVLLDAVDHEADQLEALEVRVYQVGSARARRGGVIHGPALRPYSSSPRISTIAAPMAASTRWRPSATRSRTRHRARSSSRLASGSPAWLRADARPSSSIWRIAAGSSNTTDDRRHLRPQRVGGGLSPRPRQASAARTVDKAALDPTMRVALAGVDVPLRRCFHSVVFDPAMRVPAWAIYVPVLKPEPGIPPRAVDGFPVDPVTGVGHRNPPRDC